MNITIDFSLWVIDDQSCLWLSFDILCFYFCTCYFAYLKKYFSFVWQYQETSLHTVISITIFVCVFFLSLIISQTKCTNLIHILIKRSLVYMYSILISLNHFTYLDRDTNSRRTEDQLKAFMTQLVYVQSVYSDPILTKFDLTRLSTISSTQTEPIICSTDIMSTNSVHNCCVA